MSIPAQQAMEHALDVGGRLVDLTRRESRGHGRVCPWDLVVTIGQGPKDRAAAAWIIADEVMQARTDLDDRAYIHPLPPTQTHDPSAKAQSA
ncbi:hypothetical protein [Streptomyces virginiae]|uniref:hypothetical protein n=1 Tax=Streptomyces virginiae TaxID=1961 RepID=UPI002253CF0B|nr:hypothetical protein [Streptomyces virginiae]MCX4721190.1 hypothetical protein [Streptomyces virginiae]MCX5275703.1 hypothetical protein [Streptomyces virginiae]